MLGPLATFPEPHTYDLCATHAMRLTVPQGWEVIRLVGDLVERGEVDDLLAVADAVSARPPARVSESQRRQDGEDEENRFSGTAGGRPATKPAPLGRPQLRVLRDI